MVWKVPRTRGDVDALRRAAADDDGGAVAMLAIYSGEGDAALGIARNPPLARRLWARAAALGEPSAITVVADRLVRAPRTFVQGVRLYRRAFRLGYTIAAENLAVTYMNLGRYREAVRWYRRAVAAGSPTAVLELARAQLYGVGTRRDTRAAFATLERLASQRLGWNNWMRIEAMQLIGDALTNGWFTRRDYRRGQVWLRRAARLDSRAEN